MSVQHTFNLQSLSSTLSGQLRTWNCTQYCNETCIYSGFCNIKLVDNYDVKIQQPLACDPSEICSNDDMPVIITDSSSGQSSVNQSEEVWIDPSRSPYVFNHYDTTHFQETPHYSIHQEMRTSRITFEPFGHKKFRNVQNCEPNQDLEELVCGVILSHLPEEVMNEKETKGKEERKFQEETVSKQPPNQKKYQCVKCHQIFDQISLLKDHMVNHTGPKYRQTRHASDGNIYRCHCCNKFLKTEEKFYMHCRGHGNPEVQCNRCRKVFASKYTLRDHKEIHSRKHPCNFCTRTYSNMEDLRRHMSTAHSVFMCAKCDFTAPNHSELNSHMMNRHEKFLGSETEMADSYIDEMVSESELTPQSPEYLDWKIDDGIENEMEEALEETYEETYEDTQPEDVVIYDDTQPETTEQSDKVKEADLVIAKVINNKAFLAKKSERGRKYTKVCDVCPKTFKRVSDIKRHLIEHVIRSTLDKTPVSKDGTLNIQCEVCRNESFTRIDKYKAHLRDHAKLTLYKCTFCNKSFSDSSNFSKHKKIHAITFFQCDLCQRKYNSKKTIAQHMDYHNKNPPLHCLYCDREFHFESMLNKHIKNAHTRVLFSKYRCRFCQQYYKTLGQKWDHEWTVHNARKKIIDCSVCGCKFRKYADLKRHCTEKHEM